MVNYRNKDVATEDDQYSKTVRRVAIMGEDGVSRASSTNPVTVSMGGAGYTDLETGELAVGSSQDGYDVKTTGGLFSVVTTSYRTIITNNDAAQTIQVFINTDNDSTKEISITAGSTFEISSFAVTNLFIDTTVGQTGTVEIILFG